MATDEELAQRVKQGHIPSLTLLVERHHSPLLGYLYRTTGGDRSVAEDLVQETFLRVLKAIQSYLYPRPFKPWLYAIATNLARDHYRRAAIRQTVTVPIDDSYGDSTEIPLDSRLLLRDEAYHVAWALTQLPDHQREVVVLRYCQEMSLAEIAATVHIPVGTVKSRLSLGLARLRVLFEEAYT